MALSTSAAVADVLRRCRLLEPAQMDEVESLCARFADPKALAGELLRRKWLTAYQANQLLQGRGEGLLLGSYVLIERLGEGGMGEVFKARNWKLGRIVALKLIRKERLDNPDAVRRFQREVRAVAALSHPNIVAALDADEIGGTHLLVMEYVEGATDLARLVKEQGPLPVAQACEYVRQAALGLQHAFERGLVHRDIKPHNLLVTGAGIVKILDMGLARLEHSSDDEKSSTMTQEGAVMGTPDYIAPEQAMESHTVDIRADLYSLGCTLYFLLTGSVPFPGGNLMQKLFKQRLEEPRPIEQLRPDVPPTIAQLVRKLMAKRPEDRYQKPAYVADALASAFGAAAGDRAVVEERRPGVVPETSSDTLGSPFAHLDTEVGMGAPPSPRRQAEGTRRLLMGAAGGSAIVVGITALLLLVLKDRSEPEPRPKDNDTAPVVSKANETPPTKVDRAWMRKVAAMTAEKQVEAVAKKLKDLNPGFDGKVTPKIADGVVTELQFWTGNVTDISPVRALRGLTFLHCSGSASGKGKLTDLSPLKGMKLTRLNCSGTNVSELSPLKGMPLWDLGCGYTKVADLAPLQGMKLTHLYCQTTKVADLSPLKDMKLTYLWCANTKVDDLSPLKGMPLTRLECGYTKVADLAPLKGMKLTCLECEKTLISDLSPLQGMPLKALHCDFKPERDAAILKSIKTLQTINGKTAKDFWTEVEKKQAPRKP